MGQLADNQTTALTICECDATLPNNKKLKKIKEKKNPIKFIQLEYLTQRAILP